MIIFNNNIELYNLINMNKKWFVLYEAYDREWEWADNVY